MPDKFHFAWILASDSSSVARWVLDPAFVPRSEPQGDPLGIVREVLLTYRLLFWEAESHDLLVRGLARLREDGEGVDTFLEELTDPLPGILQELMSHLPTALKNHLGPNDRREANPELFPSFVQDGDRAMRSKTVFLKSIHFPVYGSRLQTIQRHALLMRPRRRTMGPCTLMMIMLASLTLVATVLGIIIPRVV